MISTAENATNLPSGSAEKVRSSRVGVVAVVLTKNEEAAIQSCIRSLAWCDAVHVVDSGSSDQTVERAADAGARIWNHPFASFGQQRNWALDQIESEAEWILFLDADERSTEPFAAAVKQAVQGAGAGVAGFYCCWKTMLEGRWLRRADHFPRWQFRLVRRGRARFRDAGHGQKEGLMDGALDYIQEPYLHFPFDQGWDAWFQRHLRYAAQEAEARASAAPHLADLRGASPSERAVTLKALASRMPGWPLIRFLVSYVGKLGCLEGRQGLVFCLNMAIYEYWIRLLMRERKLKVDLTNPSSE